MSLADLAGWAGAATLVGAYAVASSGPIPWPAATRPPPYASRPEHPGLRAHLALAAAEVAGVARAVRTWSDREAAVTLGAGFAEALTCHQAVSSVRSAALGWRPSRPGAVDDLRDAARRAVTGG